MSFSMKKNTLRIQNLLVRELLCEFVATCFFMTGGLASTAQLVLSRGTKSSAMAVSVGWGLSVMVGAYTGWGVSGSHLNCAVTAGLASLGRMPLYKAPLYMVSQISGAFLAAALVNCVYSDALYHFDGGTRAVVGVNGTASIFSTFPEEWLSTRGAIIDQLVGTGMLQFGLMVLTDRNNSNIPKSTAPFLVGLLVMLLSVSMVHNCQAGINPSRDLGPRLFMLIGGWGIEVFSFRDYNWFWIPTFVPFFGAIIGGQMYYWLIGRHIPASYEDPEDNEIFVMSQSTSTIESHVSSVVDLNCISIRL